MNESKVVVPPSPPHLARETVPPPTEDEINRLEKAAWDAGVDRALVWYRDRIDQLRERMREADRAMKLDRARAIRAESALDQARKERDEREEALADLRSDFESFAGHHAATELTNAALLLRSETAERESVALRDVAALWVGRALNAEARSETAEREREEAKGQSPNQKRPWFQAEVRIGPVRHFVLSIDDSKDVPLYAFERVYAAILAEAQPAATPPKEPTP